MNSFVKKIVTVAATAALTLSSAAALAAAPLQLGRAGRRHEPLPRYQAAGGGGLHQG